MSTLKEHQEVLLELLVEFDRVCKKNNISYILFAGSMLGAVRHNGFIPWDDDLDVALLREDYNRLMSLDDSEWNKLYYMQKEISEHWPVPFSKLRKNKTTCLEKYHPKDRFIHQGIYIDIFPIDNMASNKLIKYLQFFFSRIVIAKLKSIQGYETNSYLKKIAMFVSKIFPLNILHEFAIMRLLNKSKDVHTFFAGSIKYRKGIFPRKWFVDTIEISFEGIKIPISRHYDYMLKQQYGDYMIEPPVEERNAKVHAILVDTQKDYSEYEGYRNNMKFDIYTRSIR